MELEEKETFWFFWHWFREAYDSTYDSNFRFLLGCRLSYDFNYDSDSNPITSEYQSLAFQNQWGMTLKCCN